MNARRTHMDDHRWWWDTHGTLPVNSGGTDDADGDEGGDDGTGGDGGEGTAPKTYTKKEVDAMVAKAAARAVRGFADYEELKAAKTKLDELQVASQTSEERLRLSHDKAVRERDAALQRSERTTIRSAIIAEAVKQQAIDPDAVAALVDRTDLSLGDDDEVEGVEEAVRALLAKKTYLAGPKGARRSGADMSNGQRPPETQRVTQIDHRRWLRGEDGGMTPERAKLVDAAIRAGTYVTAR